MLDSVLITNAVISGAAALGLLIVRARIIANGDGLAWRLRAILLLTALFYVFRSIDWIFDIALFRALTIVCAAGIPLAALLLTEGLLKQHAPRWLKAVAASGCILLFFCAFIPAVTQALIFSNILMAFQIAVLASCLGLLLLRSRSDFSRPENTLIDRVALVTPFIVIFLLSDYGLLAGPDFPAISGLAALMIACVASVMEARGASHSFLAFIIAATIGAALVASAALGLQNDWSLPDYIHSASIISALNLSLLAWWSSGLLKRAQAQKSLDDAFKHTENLSAYLKAISQIDLMEGFVLLGAEDLRDFDPDSLISAFGVSGYVRTSNLPRTAEEDTLLQSQVRALLDRFSARELVLISKQPLHLAVGTSAGFSDSSGSDIQTVFTVARLIAERDAEKELSN